MIHFSNVLSPAGFAKFAAEYRNHLGGRRTPGKFSCLSVPVMRHFVESLGFQVRAVDTQHFGGGRDAFIAFEKACD